MQCNLEHDSRAHKYYTLPLHTDSSLFSPNGSSKTRICQMVACALLAGPIFEMFQEILSTDI